MVNKITDGIIAKIRAINTDKVTIYIDEHKQGLKRPCYFVRLISTDARLIVGDRYLLRCAFDVEYHSDSENGVTREFNEVMNALCLQLEYITVDKELTRYNSFNAEIQDRVLHCFVDYEVFLRLTPDKLPLMMVLDQRISVKE